MPGTASASVCMFCDLLGGKGELSVAASDALTVALMDAFPAAPGHVLVVPRRHVPSLDDLTADEGSALWDLTHLMARRVKARHAPAVNLHLSDGSAAEQDVPHIHMHVIPRHADDSVSIDLPGQHVSRAELDRVAASLALD